MLKAAVPILGVLIVLLTGCMSPEMRSEVASLPTVDVNGTWTGSPTTGAATYTVVLSQSGEIVTGTLSGAGAADGPIEGVIEGNRIRLKEAGGYGNDPALIVRGDQITGIIRGTTLTLRRVP